MALQQANHDRVFADWRGELGQPRDFVSGQRLEQIPVLLGSLDGVLSEARASEGLGTHHHCDFPLLITMITH
jgi:hypothetical protein